METEKQVVKKKESLYLTYKNRSPNVELLTADNKLKLHDVFSHPQLRFFNEETAAAAVSLAITKASNSFNLGKKMSADQIIELAFDLVENMAYDSFADIVMMFKCFRQGKIGNDPKEPMKVFDGFHINKILVPAYQNLKSAEREKIHRNNKKVKQLTEEETFTLYPGFKKIKFEIEKKKVKQEFVNGPFKVFVRQATTKELLLWVSNNRRYERLENKVKFAKTELSNRKPKTIKSNSKFTNDLFAEILTHFELLAFSPYIVIKLMELAEEGKNVKQLIEAINEDVLDYRKELKAVDNQKVRDKEYAKKKKIKDEKYADERLKQTGKILN